MKNNHEQTFVPKLRFPEFAESGEWEEKELKDICAMQAGKFINASEIKQALDKGLFPCFGGNGLRGYVASFTHSGTYSLIGRQGALCGNITLAKGQFHATEHAVVVTPEDNADTLWLFYVLDLLNLNQYATGQAQPGLSVSNLERVKLKIPQTLAEQEKIAACLTSLDEVLSAERQKLEALKAHKKALLQQLFPAEGETVPTLRFPEFVESGEWEEKSLGEVGEFSSGSTPSKDIPEFWGGKIPWISAVSMYSTEINKSSLCITEAAISRGAPIAKQGSLLILVRGSMLYNRIPMGIAAIDVSFNQDVKALIISKEIINYFLLYQLAAKEVQLLNAVTATGIGAGKLETDYLKKFPIHIPSLNEQQKIAACLTSLDEVIGRQGERIEALQQHKKGLLQGLFPSAGEE